MKNLFIIILLFISLCLWAQNVPQTIDYQGRLADSDGNYLNGVVTVNFLIYDVETGGTYLWNETQDVSISNGIFHVLLGSVTVFPETLFDGADRWLEIIVGGETLSPRTIIASVPYSIKAETSYTVEVPLNLSGNVASPNSVIKGENTGTGYGVYGKQNSNSNYGYLGSSYYGVYGIHNSSGNWGYLGSSNSGVCGVSTGMAYGGNFIGGMCGVFGMVIPEGSSAYYGVYGNVSGGSGTNYGIYSYAEYGITSYAGYFSGNVHVTGTFTNPSDERFKENVQPFKNALSKIKLMNVHTFNFKQMAEENKLVLPEGKQFGLIAQELEEIIPELVVDNVHAYDKNEGIEGAERDVEKIEYKGINYIGLIPVLIEAIKELQMQNEEHQQQIEELKQQIAELK
ncbi:MAG: tail fiber domain-containing protein [Candidatus Cloacimonetes bacterium]|nr:tail fiber domain-containing protein [Candidatus Cloacimonadota bacterium]